MTWSKPIFALGVLTFVTAGVPYIGPGIGRKAAGRPVAAGVVGLQQQVGNGLAESGACAVPGVTAPTTCWVAGSPLTTSGLGLAQTCSLDAGATTTINAPVCPDGDHGTIEAGGGSCLTARVFDGTGGYNCGQDHNGSGAGAENDPNGGDYSLAIMWKVDPDTGGGDPMGVSIQESGTSVREIRMKTNSSNFGCRGSVRDGVTTANPTVANVTPAQWGICFLTYAASDGDTNGYLNGSANTANAAGPVGINFTSADLGIGKFGTSGQLGRVEATILFVALWKNLELTTDNVDAVALHWFGLTDGSDTRIPGIYRNTGPIAYWYDGQLEEMSDDLIFVGSEMGPNQTGAGTPTDGHLALTNRLMPILQSRVLSATWGQTGTSVVVCSQSESPFRDTYHPTCKITDNDGAAAEFIDQTFDITSLDTSDNVAICLYTFASDTVTDDIDISIEELNGCGGSTTQFAAQDMAASHEVRQFIHTLDDGTCTDITLRIQPVSDGGDLGDVSETGDAIVMVNVWPDRDFCLPQFAETEGSTFTGPDNLLTYTLAADDGILNGSGALGGPYTVTLTWTPYLSAMPNPTDLFVIDGSSADMVLRVLTDETITLIANGSTTLITSSVQTLAPGTAITILVEFDFDVDQYALFINGAPEGTSSTAVSPPASPTNLHVGRGATGANQTRGWISSFTVTRN